MCGITVCLSLIRSSDARQASSSSSRIVDDHSSLDPLTQSLIASNAFRGPDSTRTFTHVQALPSNPDFSLLLTISSSVLGLRGTGVTEQPLVGKRGVLAWNGQVFESDGDDLVVAAGENDTAKVFNALERGEAVGTVLSRVEGPFVSCAQSGRHRLIGLGMHSFGLTCVGRVYWQAGASLLRTDLRVQIQERSITYQTDPLARRSLLVHPTEPGADSATPSSSFLLSSTRSSLARERGTPMRALLGSEGGIIHLGRVQMNAGEEVRLAQRTAGLTQSRSTSAQHGQP